MEIVPLTSDRHAAWDGFYLTSPDAWFWHNTSWIDWNLAYRPELEQKSLSFLCKEGDRIMAAVPLMMGNEQRDGTTCRTFSFSGVPVPVPALPPGLSPARRARMMSLVFEVIEAPA